MHELILTNYDKYIMVTNNSNDQVLTMRELRYPTKSVPIPYVGTVMKNTVCKFTGRVLPEHITVLLDKKALLHAHVYRLGEYFSLLTTDNRDEEEFDFSITQTIPDHDIPFAKWDRVYNDAATVTSSNGMQEYRLEDDGSTVYIIPMSKKEADSTIIYKYEKNKIRIQCENPKHKMRLYIPAALYFATRITELTRIMSLYNNEAINYVSKMYDSMYEKCRRGEDLTQDDVIELTSKRYMYFNLFCKFIDRVSSLTSSKKIIETIDVLSNCSFLEFQGTGHWMYEVADYFIKDCNKKVTKELYVANKPSKNAWL